jgi:hypothetical protein
MDTIVGKQQMDISWHRSLFLFKDISVKVNWQRQIPGFAVLWSVSSAWSASISADFCHVSASFSCNGRGREI